MIQEFNGKYDLSHSGIPMQTESWNPIQSGLLTLTFLSISCLTEPWVNDPFIAFVSILIPVLEDFYQMKKERNSCEVIQTFEYNSFQNQKTNLIISENSLHSKVSIFFLNLIET